MARPEIDLEALADSYARGRYLEAHRTATETAPLEEWSGPEQLIWAARLTTMLGAGRQGQLLTYRAWRAERGHPGVAPYLARTLLDRRGPYGAWRFLRTARVSPGATPVELSHWYSAHASTLALLRDFERAESWIERALATTPDDAWSRVEQAAVLLLADRREEADAALSSLLKRHPWYRPAVQLRAATLLQLGRRGEAIRSLRSSLRHLECGYVPMSLARLLIDDSEHAEAREMVELASRQLPLAEPPLVHHLESLRAEIAYQTGSWDEARTHARATGENGFFEHMATRLDDDAQGEVVLLDLPHISQDHNTCGPATLATIAPYWSRPIDQLEVAQAICYDGTPDHVERHWAEGNGWSVREFSVSWDTAVALITQGVPFALNTVDATSAHLQAVAGVDTRLQTLLIRDPSRIDLQEMIAQPMLEQNRATGPRGMAMVPIELEARLEGIEFPDRGLFDGVYRMKRALAEHDRSAAQSLLGELEAQNPRHPLVIRARWTLCIYDDDTLGTSECIDALLEQFPDDEGLLLRRSTVLLELGRADERHEMLREIVARPRAHPVFKQQLAEDLRMHAHGWDEAEALLRTGMRSVPGEAILYKSLGDLRATQQQLSEVLDLLRFAACLEETREAFSEAYFHHARIAGHTEEALDFLRARFERLGDRSSAPTETLFWALNQLGRGSEAFALLDEALEQRPQDAELRAFSASEQAGRGEFERAERELEAARPRAKRSAWLRASGAVWEQRGDTDRAIAQWREVCELEPLSVDAHRQVAELTARGEGLAEALAYLAQVGADVPDHRGLRTLRIEFLRGNDEPAAESLLRELIARSPHDAWAQRELALCLLDQDRAADALTAARRGLELDPRSAGSHTILGCALEAAGDAESARAHQREAITIDVDNGAAIAQLVDSCTSTPEKVEALAFVASELERQVVFGEGLGAYRRAASAVLDPEAVLDLLQRAIAARPELWTAWSELVRQLVAMDRTEDAAERVRSATDRFPLVAELWLDRAEVAAALGEHDERLEALERACRIAPQWGWVTQELAIVLQAGGELARGRSVMEAAILRWPQDAQVRGCLADILWQQEEREPAITELERALHLDPGYGWAWKSHGEFVGEDRERTRSLARAISQQRAGDPRAWLALAEIVEETTIDEALQALDRALELDPKFVEASDRRMQTLARAGRFDQALAEPGRANLGEAERAPLDARAAWVLAERGDLVLAVEQMRESLERSPSLFWGWQQLEDWCEQLADGAGAVTAARAMTALAPGNPASWGYLGSACLINGDASGARQAFQRAFNLAPAYGWAGLNLFDLDLAADDLEAATATCLRLESQDADEFVLARRIQLDLRLERPEAALASFGRLCEIDSSESWPVEASASALHDAGLTQELEAALDRHLASEAPVARVAEVWAQRHLEAGRARHCRRRIDALLETAPAPRVALRAFVGALGNRATITDSWHRMRLCNAHREVLRADDDLWGIYGYALARARQWRRAIRWLDDWRAREGAEAWMLEILSLALRERGLRKRAAEVSRSAIETADPAGASSHRLWLAWEALRSGDGELADEWIGPLDVASLSELDRILLDAVVAVRSIERAEPGERGEAFRAARQALDAAAAPAARRRYTRTTYHRFIRRVGWLVGPRAWPWMLMRLLAI